MYRGGAEQKIRKYLVDNNFIDCVIQLPSNLFFGTSIATCIMVLKKSKKDTGVLFIDASNECVKVTNNNKLTPENIQNIVDCFIQRADKDHFAHLASYDELVMNEWHEYVAREKEAALVQIIEEENLNPEGTRLFVENAFRDGQIKTTGTDIEKIMPPVSRFGGANRNEKKKGIIAKLLAFFDRFFGIG